MKAKNEGEEFCILSEDEVESVWMRATVKRRGRERGRHQVALVASLSHFGSKEEALDN